MLVQCTKEDMAKAEQARAQYFWRTISCPVAQTLIRLGYKDVGVGYNCAHCFKDGVYHEFEINCGSQIRQLDEGQVLEPFEFEMKEVETLC